MSRQRSVKLALATTGPAWHSRDNFFPQRGRSNRGCQRLRSRGRTRPSAFTARGSQRPVSCRGQSIFEKGPAAAAPNLVVCYRKRPAEKQAERRRGLKKKEPEKNLPRRLVRRYRKQGKAQISPQSSVSGPPVAGTALSPNVHPAVAGNDRAAQQNGRGRSAAKSRHPRSCVPRVAQLLGASRAWLAHPGLDDPPAFKAAVRLFARHLGKAAWP